jgi:hypothetical protein
MPGLSDWARVALLLFYKNSSKYTKIIVKL